MVVGLPGLNGRNAVPNVDKAIKGETGDATIRRQDGVAPCAKDLMSKEQSAMHPVPVRNIFAFTLSRTFDEVCISVFAYRWNDANSDHCRHTR